MKKPQQKPDFRSIKKKRVNNGLDVDKLKKPHDPYQTIYKENFCNGSKMQSQKTTTVAPSEKINDLISVKSMPLNQTDSNLKTSKKVSFGSN